MKPKSLSATALQVAELCLARYKVEKLGAMPTIGNLAASVGSAVHLTLENLVRDIFIDHRIGWEADWIEPYYKAAYCKVFNNSDFASPEYKEGLFLVDRWFHKTDLTDPPERRVLSVENKLNFPVPTSTGEIPFNYIFDRLDEVEPGIIEVVDYKTSKWNISTQDLEERIQPRAYALAARILHPDAKKIWVTFDMIRYEPVGLVFTKEDNADFWYRLKRAAQRIVDAPEDAPATINAECRFCPIKARCPELNKNILGGGIHSLTITEAAKKKEEVDNRLKALTQLSDDLEKVLLSELEAEDATEMHYDGYKVSAYVSKRRKANNEAIARIIGPELSSRMGKFGLTELDNLLKSGQLTLSQAQQVQANIRNTYGQPSIRVKAPPPMSE